MTTDQPVRKRHILVLSPNPFEIDSRIRKQIESMVACGFNVTVLLTGDKNTPPSRRVSDALQVYRLDDTREQQFEMLPDWIENDTFGEVGQRLRSQSGKLSAVREGYHAVRRAVKLKRALDFVTCLPKTRNLRRDRLKEGLRLAQTGVEQKIEMELRLLRPAYFFLAAWRFVKINDGLKDRIAEVGPPDLVHGNDLFCAPTAIELAKLYNARAVYDAHEYEPERNPPMPAAAKEIVIQLEDRVLERADAVVTTSASFRDFYLARKSDLDINLVFNCPEMRAETGEVTGIRDRCGIDETVPVFVYIGVVFVGARGLQVSLDALREVPGAVLAVIGPRRSQADAELRQAAAEAGLDDRLKLLEPVYPNEVVPAIADATATVCLIQPTTLSYKHSMPNKLFESALAGVPVIGSDLPDIGGFVRDFGAGVVVDEADASAVAEGMRQIIADPDAHKPSPEQQDALLAQYSWEAQERTLIGLYNRLIDAQQPAEQAAAS